MDRYLQTGLVFSTRYRREETEQMLDYLLRQSNQAFPIALLGLAVSAAFALLGFIGLPANLERSRKLYWVIVIFLASTLMTTVIANLASFQVSLTAITKKFDTVAAIAPVVEKFEAHFHGANEPLKEWADAALLSEEGEFTDGYVDLRVDQ